MVGYSLSLCILKNDIFVKSGFELSYLVLLSQSQLTKPLLVVFIISSCLLRFLLVFFGYWKLVSIATAKSHFCRLTCRLSTTVEAVLVPYITWYEEWAGIEQDIKTINFVSDIIIDYTFIFILLRSDLYVNCFRV